jgi:hypothetical protein
MITYFVTTTHRYTMDRYLQTWGAALQPIIQVRNYGQLAQTQWLPGGTYIFSDLERLTSTQRAIATEVWQQLEAAGSSVRLFNHPTRVLQRPDFLRALHANGRNEFNVYRVSETRTPARFPVFLRCANDHQGSRTELLRTQSELDEALRIALCHALNPRELMIVEYCNAADADGVHHKFAAFGVAGQIIPRHLIFSRNWVLKLPDLLDGDKLDREREFLRTNPHEQIIREAFQLAHIDYGRCDYSVIQGRTQIWEINTNPIVLMLPKQYHPSHLPSQQAFADQIRAIFQEINVNADPKLQIPIRLDRAVLDRVIAATAG